MEDFEQAFIQECLRFNRKALGFDELKDAAAEMVELDSGLSKKTAENYIFGHGGKSRDSGTPAALQLVQQHRTSLLATLVGQGNHAAAEYLNAILNKHGQKATSVSDKIQRTAILEHMTHSWRRPFAKGEKSLATGVYQVFRRYKPKVHEYTEGELIGQSFDPSSSDIVVVELFYVDSEMMECVLVTSERNVYWGTLYIDHEYSLYAILQRPNGEANGINHRFYAVHLGRHDRKAQNPYSGLYIKAGDHTRRPLCGECIFQRARSSEHKELYEEMRALLETDWEEVVVEPDSVVTDYVSGFESGDRANLMSCLADFPFMASISVPDDEGVLLLREPSRTVESLVLSKRAEKIPLTIFQQSKRHEAADITS